MFSATVRVNHTKPLVSIITPSYNQALFLEHTIRSVLLQDYPNIEYIIVDGGSIDGSVEIIKSYQEYLTWWVSEPDQGQAQAINKGISRASGDIIAWLNSDDLYLPGAISAVVEVFQDRSEACMVFGNALSIDEDGKPFNEQRFGDLRLEDFMAFNIICQPAAFMQHSCLDKAGKLDESYHYLLDHQLWLRIVNNGSAVYTPQLLACARYHSSAKNIAQAAGFGHDAYRILEWMHTQPHLFERLKKHRRKIWAGAHRFNARYLLDGGMEFQALFFYIKALYLHPPTALKEWRRIIFTLFSLVGMRWMGKVYYRRKQKESARLARCKGIGNVQEINSKKEIVRSSIKKHETI
jgi:glycosyltransferase involved in cell wall biosynthesis